MLKTWIRLRLVQILLDTLGVYGAFVLAYFMRVGWIFSTDFPFAPYAWVAALSTLFWMVFLFFTKYYRIPPRSGKRRIYDMSLAFVGGVIAVAVLIVSYFFQRELFFSRLINIYVLLFGTGYLLLSQMVFFGFLSRLKKQEKAVYRTLIIGANRVADRIIHSIEKDAVAPYRIIGVIDPYGLAKSVEGSTILGKLNKLEEICDKERITAIIQCDAFEHTINLIALCEEKDIKYQFEPALRGIFEENLRVREVAGMTMISFVKRDFGDSKKRLLYRGADAVLRQVFDVD